MNRLTPEHLKALREQYPAGCRVRLTRMNDPYRPDLKAGALGTVLRVDDIGTIHVAWDCGSSLGVVLGEDSCTRIDEEDVRDGEDDEPPWQFESQTAEGRAHALSALRCGYDERPCTHQCPQQSCRHLHLRCMRIG